MEKKKIMIEQEIKCPSCKKWLTARHTKLIIEPSIKAETEEEIVIEPSKQTRLTEPIKKEKKKVVN